MILISNREEWFSRIQIVGSEQQVGPHPAL